VSPPSPQPGSGPVPDRFVSAESQDLPGIARIPLATLPTALHELPQLRNALGGGSRCPRILIKRDDLTGLALGGNKARKLEFLIADALTQGATVVITTGAAQSNHARMTAAAARAAGLRVELILTADADPPLQGNLLLDRLFGAALHFVPPPHDPTLATSDEEEAKVREVLASLEGRGERPYVIPVGGSSGVGVLGYFSGTQELLAQLAARGDSVHRLYFASGSRGTQAGITLGAKHFNAPYEVYGVAVSGGESFKRDRALRIANEAAAIARIDTRLTPNDLVTDQSFIGEGYGIPTTECLEAIELMAQHEGILLDPVYTAKAMAALIRHVREQALDPAATIVFLHTGGVPALFAHARLFERPGARF
jgi:D-cysteine desulfhydrase family pyridoxal phosphate-dependent enzyme